MNYISSCFPCCFPKSNQLNNAVKTPLVTSNSAEIEARVDAIVADYGSKIATTESQPEIVKLFVKDSNGKTVVVDVDMNKSVAEAKEKIAQRMNTPLASHVIRLLYAGRSLEDGKLISDYGKHMDGHITVMIRPD